VDSVKTITINPLPKVSDISFEIRLPANRIIDAGTAASICAGTDISVNSNYRDVSLWELVFTENNIEYQSSTSILRTHDNPSHNTAVSSATHFNVIRVVNKITGCENQDNSLLSALGINILIKSPVTILQAPVDAGICLPGGTVELNVVALGDASDTLTYRWLNQDNNIVGDKQNYTADDEGTYTVEVLGGCNIVTANAIITKDLPVIVQIRNHTLLVNNNPATNGGYKFIYYKWFKDGELIWENGGFEQKGGYYYTGGQNLDYKAVYQAVVMDENGVEHYTCPFTPIPLRVEAKVSSYPNPIKSSSPIVKVKADVSSEAELYGATIAIISPLGVMLDIINVSELVTEITLPNIPGTYIIQFRSEAVNQEFKTIVVE
jgi:hypothetical protein